MRKKMAILVSAVTMLAVTSVQTFGMSGFEDGSSVTEIFQAVGEDTELSAEAEEPEAAAGESAEVPVQDSFPSDDVEVFTDDSEFVTENQTPESDIAESIPSDSSRIESSIDHRSFTDGSVPEEQLFDSGEEEADDTMLTASNNEITVDLYALNSSYAEKLKIPSSYKQSYQINVSGGGTAAYQIISGNSVTVSSEGLVKPKSTTWYWNGNVGSTSSTGAAGEIKTVEYEYGTSVIEVKTSKETYKVSVTVKNYAAKYAEDAIDKYIAQNIESTMTNMEKLEKIAYFPCRYDYSPYYSSAVSMIVFGGGDCWASTDAIIWMCEKIGFEARVRDGRGDPGAGSGHMNALVKVDGKFYVVEAGYVGYAPRMYSIYEEAEYAYSVNKDGKTITITKYNGVGSSVEIPETIDGYQVTEIGEDAFAYHDEIQYVKIPSSVRSLKAGAFYGTGITSVKIPENVAEIGDDAFVTLIDYNGPSGNYGTFIDTEIIEIPATVKTLGVSLKDSIVLYHGTEAQWKQIQFTGSYSAPKTENLFFSSNGISLSSNSVSLTPGKTQSVKIYSAASNISVSSSDTSVVSISTKNEVKAYHFLRDGKGTPLTQASKTLSIKALKGGKAVLTISNGSASVKLNVTVSCDLSACQISMASSAVYTGKALTPTVKITNGSTVLKQGTDYTVTYSANIKLGTATATIKGIGAYTGMEEKTFKIVLGTPVLKSAVSAGYNATKITWGAVAGAKTYNVYYKAGSSKSWKLIKNGVTATSYTHVSSKAFPLVTGTEYTYTVRAVIGKNISSFDAAGKKVKPVTSAPKLGKVTSVAYNQQKITWSKVAGVTGYVVYQKIDGKWKKLGVTKQLSYINKNDKAHPVLPGVTNTYTVRSYRKVGSTNVYGGYSKTGISGKSLLANPAISKITKTTKGLKLEWKKINGAAGYVVQRYDSGKWVTKKTIKSVKTLTYTDTTVKKGKTYKYRIVAYCNVNGKPFYSAYSAAKSGKF